MRNHAPKPCHLDPWLIQSRHYGVITREVAQGYLAVWSAKGFSNDFLSRQIHCGEGAIPMFLRNPLSIPKSVGLYIADILDSGAFRTWHAPVSVERPVVFKEDPEEEPAEEIPAFEGTVRHRSKETRKMISQSLNKRNYFEANVCGISLNPEKLLRAILLFERFTAKTENRFKKREDFCNYMGITKRMWCNYLYNNSKPSRETALYMLRQIEFFIKHRRAERRTKRMKEEALNGVLSERNNDSWKCSA